MTDDLVKRLRVGIHTSVDPLALTNEAADRIEAQDKRNKELEADNTWLRSEYWCYTCPCEKKLADQKTRIELLEAALR